MGGPFAACFSLGTEQEAECLGAVLENFGLAKICMREKPVTNLLTKFMR